jgi:hypothetical protein
VQVGAGKAPAGAFGRIHAALIDAAPHVGTVPELGEGPVDAR